MNQCIYSKKTSPEVKFDKAEHIIPAGIGGMKTLSKGMVSDEANELFSKLELDFMRNSVISLPRQFHGPGKRGSLSKNKATKSKIHLLTNSECDNDLSLGYIKLAKPHTIPQIKTYNNKEISFHAKHPIDSVEAQLSGFIDDLKDCKDEVQPIIDENIPYKTILLGHFKDKRNNKFYGAINNENELNSLTDFVKKIIEGNISKLDNARSSKIIVNSNQSMRFSTDSYFRIGAKIAFNYLSFIKGRDFVLQDIFNPIREFIIKGGENRFVELDNNRESYIPEELNNLMAHSMSIRKTPNNKLLVFLNLYGNHFPMIIKLSDNFIYKFDTKTYICNWSEKKEGDLIDFL